MKSTVILASESTSKRALLARLLRDFQVQAPEVDETPLADETIREMVQRLAIKKAYAITTQVADAIIIATDQVAALNGEVLGKPGTLSNAKAQLTKMSGQCVGFDTGLAIVDGRSGDLHCHHIHHDIIFKSLSPAVIDAYLAFDAPLACAGSFKLEAGGIGLIAHLSGPDFTAVSGLPLVLTAHILQQCGLSLYETIADNHNAATA